MCRPYSHRLLLCLYLDEALAGPYRSGHVREWLLVHRHTRGGEVLVAVESAQQTISHYISDADAVCTDRGARANLGRKEGRRG